MSRVNCEKGPARTRPMAKVSTGSNAGCPKRLARQEASMSGTCLCRSQAAGTGTPAEKRQQVIRPGRGGINRLSTPRLLRSAIRHRASKAVNQNQRHGRYQLATDRRRRACRSAMISQKYREPGGRTKQESLVMNIVGSGRNQLV